MSAVNRDSKLVARQFFDLNQTAKDVMRQNLRRRYPKAGEEELQVRLIVWLHSRPNAEWGDVGGPIRVRELPEQLR